MRRMGITLLALAAGCGSEVTSEEVCALPDHELAKAFLIGDDFVGANDDPRFSMEVVVRGGTFDAPTMQRFEPYAQPVRFEITEDYLIARHASGTTHGRVVTALSIDHHLSNACEGPLFVAPPCHLDGFGCFPAGRPWNELEQMQVDWTRNYVPNDLWTDGIEPRWPRPGEYQSREDGAFNLALEEGRITLDHHLGALIPAEGDPEGCEDTDYTPGPRCLEGDLDVRLTFTRR